MYYIIDITDYWLSISGIALISQMDSELIFTGDELEIRNTRNYIYGTLTGINKLTMISTDTTFGETSR